LSLHLSQPAQRQAGRVSEVMSLPLPEEEKRGERGVYPPRGGLRKKPPRERRARLQRRGRGEAESVYSLS